MSSSQAATTCGTPWVSIATLDWKQPLEAMATSRGLQPEAAVAVPTATSTATTATRIGEVHRPNLFMALILPDSCRASIGTSSAQAIEAS